MIDCDDHEFELDTSIIIIGCWSRDWCVSCSSFWSSSDWLMMTYWMRRGRVFWFIYYLAAWCPSLTLVVVLVVGGTILLCLRWGDTYWMKWKHILYLVLINYCCESTTLNITLLENASNNNNNNTFWRKYFVLFGLLILRVLLFVVSSCLVCIINTIIRSIQ